MKKILRTSKICREHRPRTVQFGSKKNFFNSIASKFWTNIAGGTVKPAYIKDSSASAVCDVRNSRKELVTSHTEHFCCKKRALSTSLARVTTPLLSNY